MSTENQSRASSLNELMGEIADAELDNVRGGDKATTKTATKSTTKSTDTYFAITMQEVTISS